MPRILGRNVALPLRTKWSALTAQAPNLAVLPEDSRADIEALVPDPGQRDWPATTPANDSRGAAP